MKGKELLNKYDEVDLSDLEIYLSVNGEMKKMVVYLDYSEIEKEELLDREINEWQVETDKSIIIDVKENKCEGVML